MDKKQIEARTEKGKQSGFSDYIEINGKLYYEAVAIQKYQDKYFVDFSRIEESKMSGEEFEMEKIEIFNKIDEAFDYIETQTSFKIEQLGVLKGQRIFNPKSEI